jgi:hypothetical protein
MSEVIPEDEDRGGAGAIGADDGKDKDNDDDQAGGTGPDDGGAGSQNM